MPREIGQPGQARAATFRECDLKICELCGWLNLESNEECFVCGWRGRFERDAGVIHAAIELAVRAHGRIELQHLTDVSTYRHPPVTVLTGRWSRWIGLLRTLFRRRTPASPPDRSES